MQIEIQINILPKLGEIQIDQDSPPIKEIYLMEKLVNIQVIEPGILVVTGYGFDN